MNPDLAEKLLRSVIGETAETEFPDQLGILRSLATYKYDDYQQYAPGRQFIAYLALWLAQFHDSYERRNALRFVRQRLVYISDVEMRHLVSLMARDRVPSVLQRQVSQQLALPAYRVAAGRTKEEFRRAVRASLFLGMSDGARIDQFRRSSPELSNEQFAMNYELTGLRTEKMITELRTDLHDKEAVFEYIFLVDDFAGSGRTILRRDEAGGLDGRLVRFVKDTLPNLKERTCPKIFIALYLATEQAVNDLQALISAYPSPPWHNDNKPQLITVNTLGDHVRLCQDRECGEHETDRLFDVLLHKYYDKSVEDEHKGPVLHGYSDCGLPLVLAHNTPNNSVFLLWEKEKTQPLFPRFERHQSPLGNE
jgi:hypothetical protein